MVKRKTTKSDDISNWAVVLMLVAVIVVSTLSIVLFMDAADGAIATEASDVGTVSLEVVNPDAQDEVLSNDSSVEAVVESAEEAGTVTLEIRDE